MSFNSEDSVRDPDPVICERLVDFEENPTNSVFRFPSDNSEPNNASYDLEKAIQESLREYEKEIEKHESDLLTLINMEIKVRKQRFENIRKYITRMCALDLKHKSVYETFYNYIYLYETENIDYFVVEHDYYNKFFELISSSRLSKDDIDNCKQLIRLL
jgi:hypothetical protein